VAVLGKKNFFFGGGGWPLIIWEAQRLSDITTEPIKLIQPVAELLCPIVQ